MTLAVNKSYREIKWIIPVGTTETTATLQWRFVWRRRTWMYGRIQKLKVALQKLRGDIYNMSMWHDRNFKSVVKLEGKSLTLFNGYLHCRPHCNMVSISSLPSLQAPLAVTWYPSVHCEFRAGTTRRESDVCDRFGCHSRGGSKLINKNFNNISYSHLIYVILTIFEKGVGAIWRHRIS